MQKKKNSSKKRKFRLTAWLVSVAIAFAGTVAAVSSAVQSSKGYSIELLLNNLVRLQCSTILVPRRSMPFYLKRVPDKQARTFQGAPLLIRSGQPLFVYGYSNSELGSWLAVSCFRNGLRQKGWVFVQVRIGNDGGRLDNQPGYYYTAVLADYDGLFKEKYRLAMQRAGISLKKVPLSEFKLTAGQKKHLAAVQQGKLVQLQEEQVFWGEHEKFHYYVSLEDYQKVAKFEQSWLKDAGAIRYLTGLQRSSL